jgi:hypothetical protein
MEEAMTSLEPTRAALVQLDLPAGRVRVRPHDDRVDGVDPEIPTAVVVTSWCPGDAAALFADDDRRHRELVAEAEALGHTPRPAAVYDRDGRWHLAAVALELVGDEAEAAGFRLASFAAQDRYRLVGPDGVTEVFLRSGHRRRTPAAAAAVPRLRCVVPDPDGKPCRTRAGAFPNKGRFNSMELRAQRHSAVRALDCDDCGGCNLPSGGRGIPISLVPLLDPAPGDERRAGEVGGPGYGPGAPEYTPKAAW